MKKVAMFLLIAVFSMSAFAGTGDLRRSDNPIQGQYIVVLEDFITDIPGAVQALSRVHGGEVGYIYDTALRGFSIRLPEPAARALARDPYVKYVEEDGEVEAIASQTISDSGLWGLDRINQRDLPLNGYFTYTYTGNGVRVYVIDTGIRSSHAQFEGRAMAVYDAFGGNGSDCNGHGTHVAGTIGGKTYGVAKKSLPRGVRVLDCNGSGSWSGVIAGIDWVTKNHIKPAVANLSLGGSANSSVDTAVKNLISAGVTTAVAAGNSNADACYYSPARVAAALTVGSTTKSDYRSSFSNYGSCVDLFAPGSSIKSAWYTSDSAYNTISGTSMASPHVAGVAALYLHKYGHQSPSTVNGAIINNATTSRLKSIGSGSPNRLLFTNY